MPVLPGCLIEPIWTEFSALLPVHPAISSTHPLGGHRPRVPDRVVFDRVLAALIHGSGYERIALRGCSDRTVRRRLHTWAERGLVARVHELVLQAYDCMIGLELDDLAVDGCFTKAPVGRGRRSQSRGSGQAGPCDRHSPPSGGGEGESARCTAARTTPGWSRPARPAAPLQAGTRWVVERTQAGMNGYGKLRRCTEWAHWVVDFYVFLTAAFVVTRCLIQRARKRYRWTDQPTTLWLT